MNVSGGFGKNHNSYMRPRNVFVFKNINGEITRLDLIFTNITTALMWCETNLIENYAHDPHRIYPVYQIVTENHIVSSIWIDSGEIIINGYMFFPTIGNNRKMYPYIIDKSDEYHSDYYHTSYAGSLCDAVHLARCYTVSDGNVYRIRRNGDEIIGYVFLKNDNIIHQ